jgi:EAL domain-containing protein (putative c-di-GMP-specific phosphodiesterase class I)
MDIDYLKIHGDFFKDFIHNPVNHAMAKSINEIAHILHIKTIAVHIDDNEKFNELINIGIDYAQGFVIDKPVSLDKLCKQLSVNN